MNTADLLKTDLLKVDHLVVKRSLLSVIEGVSLQIHSGEMVCLIGSNGAGKSTLIEAILGIIPTETGAIFLDKECLDDVAAHGRARKGLAWVPEGRRVFPDLTILENLRMGAYSVQDPKMTKRNLEWVYQLFPVLSNRSDQFAGTLSGGEQQMVAIARALMASPRVLILDELSLGLAPKIVIEVFASLKKIAELGISLLVVEQNAELALNFCDRGYVLDRGRMVQSGRAEDLLKDGKLRDAYFGAV
jgi:branched-chain amino acid transport system ATP-binding protein